MTPQIATELNALKQLTLDEITKRPDAIQLIAPDLSVTAEKVSPYKVKFTIRLSPGFLALLPKRGINVVVDFIRIWPDPGPADHEDRERRVYTLSSWGETVTGTRIVRRNVTLIIFVDPENNIPESDEGNNDVEVSPGGYPQ